MRFLVSTVLPASPTYLFLTGRTCSKEFLGFLPLNEAPKGNFSRINNRRSQIGTIVCGMHGNVNEKIDKLLLFEKALQNHSQRRYGIVGIVAKGVIGKRFQILIFVVAQHQSIAMRHGASK